MSKFEGPKSSSVDRFLGGTKDQQESAREVVERIFEEQEIGELKKFERQKTAEELEAIDIVNRETDKLREKYGLPPRRILPENFHVLTKESRESFSAPAALIPARQAIAIVETETKTEMIKRLLHEKIHYDSFSSVKVGSQLPITRQTGLDIKKLEQGRHRRTFTRLNEAVTEALTKRVMRDIESLPNLEDETTLINKARAFGNDEVAFAKTDTRPDGSAVNGFYTYSYQKERQALDLLINKLMERSPEVGENHTDLNYEGWFDEFAKAMFTGDLTTIGRAVERTFGKGTYKKLGEPADGPAFLKFVQAL